MRSLKFRTEAAAIAPATMEEVDLYFALSWCVCVFACVCERERGSERASEWQR
jgi:hypothetical protein